MIASNNSTALAADAAVEEGGASFGDIGGGAARRPREEHSSSGAASEKAVDLQPPKQTCKRSQRMKALGFRVEFLTNGLRVEGRDASFFRVMSVPLKIWS
jgi:hypothetical protein